MFRNDGKHIPTRPPVERSSRIPSRKTNRPRCHDDSYTATNRVQIRPGPACPWTASLFTQGRLWCRLPGTDRRRLLASQRTLQTQETPSIVPGESCDVHRDGHTFDRSSCTLLARRRRLVHREMLRALRGSRGGVVLSLCCTLSGVHQPFDSERRPFEQIACTRIL